MGQIQAFKNLKGTIYESRKTRRIKNIRKAFSDYEKAKKPFYIKMLHWCIDFWKKERFNISLHQQKTVKKKIIKPKAGSLERCPACEAKFIANPLGACQGCGWHPHK